jgi:hypothetical protein
MDINFHDISIIFRIYLRCIVWEFHFENLFFLKNKESFKVDFLWTKRWRNAMLPTCITVIGFWQKETFSYVITFEMGW